MYIFLLVHGMPLCCFVQDFYRVTNFDLLLCSFSAHRACLALNNGLARVYCKALAHSKEQGGYQIKQKRGEEEKALREPSTLATCTTMFIGKPKMQRVVKEERKQNGKKKQE